ncbi:MAG: cyclic nucleotide-binding domain-containing protein [Actinomycetes bacterium]
MRSVKELLLAHPLFDGLDEETVAQLSGCAVNVHFGADEFLFRTGEPADRFFMLRHGGVALDVVGPGERQLVVDTVGPGGVVGVSWLVPPYRWAIDARATESTSAVALDATCLRARFEADPRVGYQLLQRVVSAMSDRLYSARIRLLDLYGTPSAR